MMQVACLFEMSLQNALRVIRLISRDKFRIDSDGGRTRRKSKEEGPMWQQRQATMNRVFILVGLIAFQATATVLEDSDHWHKIGQDELQHALSQKWNTGKAKNVIVFVGDGMSPDTITASRIYQAGETSRLAWERFPHIGLLKTYNTNKRVPDSASTATALFGGVKTNYEVVGVNVHVSLADCEASLNSSHHVHSFITWAQAAGKDTGFVTTTRVTHATPAALYAHAPDRRWECEAAMGAKDHRCLDIGRQLVQQEPGKNIKVILGGGRQQLQSNVTGSKADPIDSWACYSQDGRDLIGDWSRDKSARKLRHEVVRNSDELSRVDTEKIDYLLGVFSNSHIKMDWERDKGPKGQPSLEQMTVAALKILRKSEAGYVLMVEGGLIDYAHHRGHAAQALLETVRLSEAIEATLKMVNLDDTLIIVTSDHTHSMSFNGISDRASPILGIAQRSKHDGTPYTTLTYSTGGPNNAAYNVVNGSAMREDPSMFDTTDFRYSQQAAIVSNEAHHGGGDVAVYATGPFAHLFHTVHEQNYVAHVIAYAAGIGPYATNAGEYAFDMSTAVTCGLISITVLALY